MRQLELNNGGSGMIH